MAKNRIAEFRRNNDMNQRELGQQLGVAQTTVSAWEIGRNEPDSESLNRMAKMFHTTIGYLMGYEPASYLRGLTPDEFERVKIEQSVQRGVQRWEEQKAYEQQGLTEDEIEDIIRVENQARYESSGSTAETLEGFLASEIVDKLPVGLRQQALSTLRTIANAYTYKP